MSELPEGWIETTFEKVADIQLGKMLDKNKNVGEPVPYLRNINVRWGGFDLDDVFSMKMSSEERQKYSIQSGDLIVCEGGEPGRAAIWREQECQFAFQKALMRVRSNGAAMPDWMHALLIYASASGDLSERFTGTTIKHLPQRALASTPIPLPPLAEQRRIVEKLDSLTAQSREAAAALIRVKTLITRYKGAVLGEAFSGNLTKDWRAESPRLSPVIEALKTVRESRYSVRIKRRVPVSEEPALPNLPEGWAWVSPDELASDEKYSIGIGPFGSSLVKADYRTEGVRLVFVRDIRNESFLNKGAKFVTDQKAQSLSAHEVRPGDVLITKMGDPPGDTAIFAGDSARAIITADCIKLRVDARLSSPTFVRLAIRSELVQRQVAEITQGVAHQKVSLDRFRKIGIPLPPLDEQVEIVARIEAAFAQIETMNRAVTAARARLGSLDRAVLSKALRGELIPQDPNDEPASELLKRIKENAG